MTTKRFSLSSVLSVQRNLPRALLLSIVLNLLSPAFSQGASKQVTALKITILSTTLTGLGSVGEWGFAALIEADGHRILFDTGANPNTVLKNAKELGIDLSDVTEVFLSHNHWDHTGGLLALRRELMKKNPAALKNAHVGRGIFLSRPRAGDEGNGMIKIRDEFQALGGRFIEYAKPTELFPGVWVTGPIPRIHPERNWSGSGRIKTSGGLIEDTIPEDQALVLDTDNGLILISGCGHAGIINTIEFARKTVRETSVQLALGGFHLFRATSSHLKWTAEKLQEFGLFHFVGAHCTGADAVTAVRKQAGLNHSTAVVAAVGAVFELGKGINPRTIAR